MDEATGASMFAAGRQNGTASMNSQRGLWLTIESLGSL